MLAIKAATVDKKSRMSGLFVMRAAVGLEGGQEDWKEGFRSMEAGYILNKGYISHIIVSCEMDLGWSACREVLFV
jgi:hypothetical protein